MQRGRVTYSVGNENDPGNPFGRSELAVEPDGTAKLDHHQRGGVHRAFSGTAPAAELDRLFAALERAGFPNVTPHKIPGGATLRQLEVAGTSTTLPIEYYAAKKLPGYDEAFAVLDALIGTLSGGTVRA